ncbi:MAG: ABC transporter permease [Nitratireductor sp.]
MLNEVTQLFGTIGWMVVGITAIFLLYVFISWLCQLAYDAYSSTREKNDVNYTSLKTVTFGDESAVVANRIASFGAIIAIFIIWALATGSKTLPFSLPTPFIGDTQFEYTAKNPAGDIDKGIVTVRVFEQGTKGTQKPEPSADGNTGFAKNDAVLISERRSKILKVQTNDDGGTEAGYQVTEIDGVPISPESTATFKDGSIFMTKKGSLSIKPGTGWTMEALYLPPPEQVWDRFWDLNENGYQGIGLWENVFWSLIRVVIGFALGALFGIPLGYAMGLNSWLRGWFDPIVEFMRPVPPLALIPLVIIWFGIGEQGKISLLFLAALWIMTIAARAGVSGVNISKVHAAYSLGATKRQILSKVILPNSLPEIFTGARVAMGVCWGTVVAAELVAAEKGAGKMIIAASKFQLTDIVIIGIIIIGVIGYGIDVLMRIAENRLVPWKGKG